MANFLLLDRMQASGIRNRISVYKTLIEKIIENYMQVIPGNAQHQGSRKEQQDDFGFTDLSDKSFVVHGGVLALITDGMGGLALGREASLIAKSTLLKQYENKSPAETIPDVLDKALRAANSAVVEMARMKGMEGEVGTTLVAAVIKDNSLYWLSVGDSRIYLWRKGNLRQLSTDHDYKLHLSRKALNGNMSYKDIEDHPDRDALVSYLGLDQLTEIDMNEEPLIVEVGDRVLLCSDGLYNTVSEIEMEQMLSQHPQDAAEMLIEAAITKQRHNQDNVTVAILGCEPELSFQPQSNSAKNTWLNKKRFLILFASFIIVMASFAAYFSFYHISQNHTIVKDLPKKKETKSEKNLTNNEGELSKPQDGKINSQK